MAASSLRPSVLPILARAIPACALVGAAVELFMIRVRIGDETFYDVATRKEAERVVYRRIMLEEREKQLRQRVAERKEKEIMGIEEGGNDELN